MNKTFSIRPSKDLRNNYAQISLLAKENPVAITVNGKEDLIIISHESYMEEINYIQELEAKISFYNHLSQALDDVKLGRTSKLDDAVNDIFKELDEIKL